MDRDYRPTRQATWHTNMSKHLGILVENKWYIAGTKNCMQQKHLWLSFSVFRSCFCNFRRPDTTIESIYLQSSFQHEFKSAMRLDTTFVENTTLNMFFFQLGWVKRISSKIQAIEISGTEGFTNRIWGQRALWIATPKQTHIWHICTSIFQGFCLDPRDGVWAPLIIHSAPFGRSRYIIYTYNYIYIYTYNIPT